MLEKTDGLEAGCDQSGIKRVARQYFEAAIFEKLIDVVIVPNTESVTFYFSVENRPYRCEGRIRGFGRIRLYIETLAKILPEKRCYLSEKQYKSLIYDSLRLLSKNQDVREKIYKEICQTAYWVDWNRKNISLKGNSLGSPYQALETEFSDGHPYHPCFKARSGFSIADHSHYTPECAQTFQLHWLAVRRKLVSLFSHDQNIDNFWEEEQGAFFCGYLRKLLISNTDEPDEYTFVPVHPWQWENYIQRYYIAAISEKDIINLGKAGDQYLASQSLRTLLNTGFSKKANIKLSLDITNTSSVRHLFAHGVESANDISQWLSRIVEKDSFYKKHPLIILREYAGIRVLEELMRSEHSAGSCHIGAVFRESVESKLDAHQEAIPLIAICSRNKTGVPFIKPNVSKYGLDTWLKKLVDVFVLPIWHLLVKHGVAIEAHAQNSVLIIENGWPVSVAVRDFHESVEYVEEYLSSLDDKPDFRQRDCYYNAKINEYYWMSSVEALRELAMDTLFVFHLSELAELCESEWGYGEERFWKLVNECLNSYREVHPELEDRINLLNYDSSEIYVESLLKSKLDPCPDEKRHRVTNALCGSKQRDQAPGSSVKPV